MQTLDSGHPWITMLLREETEEAIFLFTADSVDSDHDTRQKLSIAPCQYPPVD